ncbi:MAG: hypothetical protein QXG16_01200 [Candidatus Anstonellaceae archaeon]
MKTQKELVDYLYSLRYIKSKKIYDAFCKLDRVNFIPKEIQHHAYLDSPLLIQDGQTISAPHMHAIVIEELELNDCECKKGKEYKILEIGTGSAYLTALLSTLCPNATIFSLENSKKLIYFGFENLKKLGFRVNLFINTDFVAQERSINLILKSGYFGLEEFAPFDRIVAGACYPTFPEFLIDQLKPNSVAIFPVSLEDNFQHLIKIKKISNKIVKTDLGLVSFVPMQL